MKATLSIISFIFFTSVSAQQLSSKNSLSDKPKKIDSFTSAISKSGQFMGAVLVAEKGKIIYKKGFGLADIKTKESLLHQRPVILAHYQNRLRLWRL